MNQRPIQSYLYDFITLKYIDNLNISNFKQEYLERVKNKQGIESIKNFIDKNFFENIEDFFNEEGKEIIQDKLGNDNLKNLIKSFEKKINTDFIFRYYQYLTILYTYFIFIIIKDKDKQENFIKNFKEYLKGFDIELNIKTFDLQRLNYWMATGSGKTYLMYFILELYLETFGKDSTDSIFLVVPAGLRYQHIKELQNIYNCEFKNYDDGKENTIYKANIFDKDIILTSPAGLNNIIKNKEINLENGKYIFIYDEGHKGAGGDGTTETNKEMILHNKNNFIFDYSATFQETIKKEIENKNKKEKNILKINTLNKYFLTSIYNYNLTFFQDDGYGKKINYFLGDLVEKRNEEENIITKRNLKKALKSFKEQLDEFKNWNNKKKLKENKDIIFYKPLFLGVSNEIGSGKEKTTEKNNLIEVINALIDIYYENDKELSSIFQEQRKKISFEIGKEEIIINLGDKKGLIYTGENGIKKIIENLKSKKEKVNISKNHKDGFFNDLDNQDDIIFLFGSKKFIEGWDSKRPSTIFMLKGAKTSTIQAVQLLGRGLRLSGYKNDGYRHLSDMKNTNKLETLYLFGQDTDALKDFLEKVTNTSIKIVKFYTTTPKNNLNTLKLPYLKAIEKEKDELIKINLTKDNIDDKKNIIYNNIKISLNNEYIKKSKKIENGYISINNDNLKEINIPYIILKPYIGNIINELNLSNNKVIFNIDDSFFEELFKIIKFKENTGMNRDEQKRFILGVIKNILTSIYFKINKENTYQIDNIGENDKDMKFNYSITIKVNVNDNKVFGLKLREDKKYNNIIELREDNLNEWFEIKDNKNLELYETIYNKVKDLDNDPIKQSNVLLDEVESLFNKGNIKKSEIKELIQIDKLKEKINSLKSQQNNKLKKIFDEYFKQNDYYNKHLYQRLFCLYNKEDADKKELEGITEIIDNEKYGIKKENIEISPNSILNLNKYEVEIIDKILESLKDKYKTIYFFRNSPGGNKYFLYKNNNGGISKFYPDFIFWFRRKDGKNDILYIDPKGNDEEKENKLKSLKELNKKFQDKEFKETIKNIKWGNNYILGLEESNNNDSDNLNNFENIDKNMNINSILGIIVSSKK